MNKFYTIDDIRCPFCKSPVFVYITPGPIETDVCVQCKPQKDKCGIMFVLGRFNKEVSQEKIEEEVVHIFNGFPQD